MGVAIPLIFGGLFIAAICGSADPEKAENTVWTGIFAVAALVAGIALFVASPTFAMALGGIGLAVCFLNRWLDGIGRKHALGYRSAGKILFGACYMILLWGGGWVFHMVHG